MYIVSYFLHISFNPHSLIRDFGQTASSQSCSLSYSQSQVLTGLNKKINKIIRNRVLSLPVLSERKTPPMSRYAIHIESEPQTTKRDRTIR